jgi:putative transposase
MSFLATTGGISGDDVQDLMVAAVEHRFGGVNRLPVTIEWLSDNGAATLQVIFAASLATSGLNREQHPSERPQSNGMAEAFVRTIKRDHVRISPRPNTESVMLQRPSWIDHYNRASQHPFV